MSNERKASEDPELVREIVARGHGVANHTQTHPATAFWRFVTSMEWQPAMSRSAFYMALFLPRPTYPGVMAAFAHRILVPFMSSTR